MKHVLGFNFARVVVGIALFAYVVLGLHAELLALQTNPVPATLMGDFKIYLKAYANVSQESDPYALGPVGFGFFYPAPMLGLMAPFAVMSLDYWLWCIAIYLTLNLSLMALMLWGIQRQYGFSLQQSWWWFVIAFAFAPFLEVLHVGQINVITLFGIFLLFVFAGRAPVLSGFGVCLAIMTKFTPIVFLAYLLAARRYRALVWAIIWLVVATLATVVVWGARVILDYPRVLANLSQTFMLGPISQSLVSLLQFRGLIESSAWTEFQLALNAYLAIVFAISFLVTWLSRTAEPFFLILAFGMMVLPNVMWYHHFAFLLLPVFLWMAWSRLHPAIVAWCLLGLGLIQLDHTFVAGGLFGHVFAHLSIAGILAWQLIHSTLARPYRIIGISIPVAVAVFFSVGAISVNASLSVARIWITHNLPVGSRIAVEHHAPNIDPRQYVVEQTRSLVIRPPEWYVQNGFEYLVFSQWLYGRLFGSPSYTTWIVNVPEFSAQFPLVAQFEHNGFEVRVYKTNATLPPHRIAARFGDYGELIELVGYDTVTPRGQPGESLHVRLFWRALKQANERLELSLHLLSRDDREIEMVRRDLFQRHHTGWVWPEGIFATEWTIPIPINADPGLYHLRVEVIQTRFAYTLPARTWAGELIPEVSLGMFKVSVPTPSAAELQAAHTANVRWSNQIELAAYALDRRTARAGDTVNLTLYWKSIAKSDKDYTVFVHLLDAQGNVRAQRDAPPRDGTYPTSIWDVGEIVRDDYTLELPRDLTLGEYRLVVGLYEYPSLARLSVTDTLGNLLGDQFVLDEIIRIKP